MEVTSFLRPDRYLLRERGMWISQRPEHKEPGMVITEESPLGYDIECSCGHRCHRLMKREIDSAFSVKNSSCRAKAAALPHGRAATILFDVSSSRSDFGPVSAFRMPMEHRLIGPSPTASVSRAGWRILKEDRLPNAATGQNLFYWSVSLVCTSRMKSRTGSGCVRFMRWPAPLTMWVGCTLVAGMRRSREPWM